MSQGTVHYLSGGSEPPSVEGLTVVGAVVKMPQSRGIQAVIPSLGIYSNLDVDSFQLFQEPPQGSHHKTSSKIDDINSTEKKMEHDKTVETLCLLEKRMDAHIDRMEKAIAESTQNYRHELMLRDEALRRELDARQKLLDAHLLSNSESVARLETDFKSVVSSNNALKFWLAGIGAAVVLGIGGMNATIFSGGKAFFDGGVEQAEVREILQSVQSQSDDNRALLEELKAAQVKAGLPVEMAIEPPGKPQPEDSPPTTTPDTPKQ